MSIYQTNVLIRRF